MLMLRMLCSVQVNFNIEHFLWHEIIIQSFPCLIVPLNLTQGYQFTFPFLSDECGLRVDDSYVHPLYKHCINAEHPTMALIGYVFTSAITQMIETQVIDRFRPI